MYFCLYSSIHYLYDISYMSPPVPPLSHVPNVYEYKYIVLK